jgi:hypothetical protein
MKPEEQRIAIAKAHLGYEDFDWLVWCDEEKAPYWEGRKLHGASGDNEWEQVLDYLNDINAMREAENKLSKDHRKQLVYVLLRVVIADLDRYTPEIDKFRVLYFATAAQRAEAFIRTIGKWNSDKINKTLE